jgi:hypothetical protein
MRRDTQGDFDGRNRRHGQKENQRCRRYILTAIEKLAQRTIVWTVVSGSVSPFVIACSSRCNDLVGVIGRDTRQRMDVRLGRHPLYEKCQKNNSC